MGQLSLYWVKNHIQNKNIKNNLLTNKVYFLLLHKILNVRNNFFFRIPENIFTLFEFLQEKY